jgi:hypothetical protein
MIRLDQTHADGVTNQSRNVANIELLHPDKRKA